MFQKLSRGEQQLRVYGISPGLTDEYAKYAQEETRVLIKQSKKESELLRIKTPKESAF